ncbi:MAG TPA: class I SAM-dependent methyltransferase, partial [Pirellulales bacterium]|nr:class I SAM-dependent methyltransferase [Pirellulales bacterium]
MRERLPDYAASQAAYHRAFGAELRQMLADVFRGRVRAALDIACGDGAYAGWLSQQFGVAVVGLDSNFSFLRLARRRPVQRRAGRQVLSLAGNALTLPFADESFDAVWCAQSLYSLPDATAVLAEMRRITRPGGTTAVLENDTLHEVILPWPPALELAIRQAEWESFCRETNDPEKFYMGRGLPEAFRSAGFSSCSLKTYAVSRAAPLDADAREYLHGYLARL